MMPNLMPMQPDWRLRPGHVLVLRTCKADMTSFGGFVWPKQGYVEAPDWLPSLGCGNGLHGLLWGEGRLKYLTDHLSRGADIIWMIVDVHKSMLIFLDDKVKFKNGNVIYAGNKQQALNILYKNAPEHIQRNMILVDDSYTAKAGNSAFAVTEDYGTSTAGNYSVAISKESGKAVTEDYGFSKTGRRGKSYSKLEGISASESFGTSVSGNFGVSISKYAGSSIVGEDGVAIVNSEGLAGSMGAPATLIFRNHSKHVVLSVQNVGPIIPGWLYNSDGVPVKDIDRDYYDY